MQVRRTTALALTLATAATSAVMAHAPATAKPPKRADLVVSTVTAPPATAQPGTSFATSATVASKGRVAAGASSVQFYLSKDRVRSSDDIAGGTAKIKKIKPKRKQTAKASIAVPQNADGTYYVVACADSRKKVKESKENNNCRSSETPVDVHGDIHGTLTGTLTFTEARETTSPVTGATETVNYKASASIAMTVDGDPADLKVASTGSTYSFEGSTAFHDEDEDCVRHRERKSAGAGTLTYTGAPFTDDIFGDVPAMDLSELGLVVSLRASWSETVTHTGRGIDPCDAYSKTTTGGELTPNEIKLVQASRSGNTIQYRVDKFLGELNMASRWNKVEGTLTLTLH
jgi:CARDB protein